MPGSHGVILRCPYCFSGCHWKGSLFEQCCNSCWPVGGRMAVTVSLRLVGKWYIFQTVFFSGKYFQKEWGLIRAVEYSRWFIWGWCPVLLLIVRRAFISASCVILCLCVVPLHLVQVVSSMLWSCFYNNRILWMTSFCQVLSAMLWSCFYNNIILRITSFC